MFFFLKQKNAYWMRFSDWSSDVCSSDLLAQFAFRHSDGKDQFDQVMSAVRSSPELVALGRDGKGEDRLTSRAMIAAEQRLDREAEGLATDGGTGGIGRDSGRERLGQTGRVAAGDVASNTKNLTNLTQT